MNNEKGRIASKAGVCVYEHWREWGNGQCVSRAERGSVWLDWKSWNWRKLRPQQVWWVAEKPFLKIFNKNPANLKKKNLEPFHNSQSIWIWSDPSTKLRAPQKEPWNRQKVYTFLGVLCRNDPQLRTAAFHDMDHALQNSWSELQMTKNPVISLENFIWHLKSDS